MHEASTWGSGQTLAAGPIAELFFHLPSTPLGQSVSQPEGRMAQVNPRLPFWAGHLPTHFRASDLIR